MSTTTATEQAMIEARYLAIEQTLDARRTAQADCRAFAEQFPTANVKRAIKLAELGRVDWSALAELFRATLADALTEVRT